MLTRCAPAVILCTLVLSTLLTSIWCGARRRSERTRGQRRCFGIAAARVGSATPHVTALSGVAPPASRSRAAHAVTRRTRRLRRRFYYSRGANCCLEIRTILDCDPVGPCLGFAGDCGDIQAQFAGVQGEYVYSDGPGDPPSVHAYLDDYVCHAFPDDAYVTDQFFVGLISVAVALPIDLFLARAFETANEGEVPGNWLDAPPGKWKLLLGKDAHNEWRLAHPRRPASELVRWLVGGGAESDVQAVLFVVGYALRRLRARLFGEPRAPMSAEEEDAGSKLHAPPSPASNDSAASSQGKEARAEALQKRLYSAAGLLGVYACWVIFAWVIFTCAFAERALRACPQRSRAPPALHHRRHAHIQDARRQRAERVCQNLGRRLRAQQRALRERESWLARCAR